MIPVGLCQCGCGKTTKVSQYKDASHGYERETPRRYALGHNGFGKRPIKDRFFARVKKGDSCWEWSGIPRRGGYGQIMVQRQRWFSHRLSWTIANGKIPDEIFVLHKCDNPICVNPDHLFLGTAEDNAQDSVAKGRSSRGERNGMAKIKADDVVEMRRRYFSGETQVALAKTYKIDRGHLSKVVNGLSWKHVR